MENKVLTYRDISELRDMSKQMVEWIFGESTIFLCNDEVKNAWCYTISMLVDFYSGRNKGWIIKFEQKFTVTDVLLNIWFVTLQLPDIGGHGCND